MCWSVLTAEVQAVGEAYSRGQEDKVATAASVVECNGLLPGWNSLLSELPPG